VINQALSAANSAIYGVVHAVIVALGCSPGLGFVHNGTYRSFVYDIADLYKADLTIPIAFDVAASLSDEAVGSAARKAVRDAVREFRLLERCVSDIKGLLSVSGALDVEDDEDLAGELTQEERFAGAHRCGEATVTISEGFHGPSPRLLRWWRAGRIRASP